MVSTAQLSPSENEAFYRTLFETSSDAIMLLGENGFFDCNQATLRIFNCATKEEFCAKTPAMLSPHSQPDGRDSMESANEKIQIAKEKGKLFFDWVHKKSTGEYFSAEVLLTPVVFQGKTVIQATVRDVSERKKIEQDLYESGQKFRAVVDSALDAIVMTDEHDLIVLWNKAGEHIFGYSQDEVIGKELHAVIPALVAHRNEKARLHHFQETGESDVIGKTLELPVARKDGTSFLVELTISRVKLYDRWHAIGVMRDITKRKQLEQQLQREREEQQTILDAIPAWVFYKDTENHFLRVNTVFATVMGKTKEQLQGASLFDLFPKEQAEAYWKDDKEVIASGKPKTNIVESMETPSGRLWVKTDKILHHDETGNVIGIIGFTIDITAQKKSEEDLHIHMQELEKMNTLMVGRELKMAQMKQELEALKKTQG